MLNQETLLLVQISITLLTTALLVSAALYTDSLREQRLWAVGNVAVCLGLVIGACTNLPVLVHGVLSYGVMGLGMALILLGLREFCRRSLRHATLLAIPIVAMLAPAFYTLVQPSLDGRLITTGFYFGALNWVCAITLSRHHHGRGTGVSVFGFGMLGLSLVLRGAYFLFAARPDQDLNNTVVNASLFMVPLAQVCIAFGLTLMVTQRYAERLRHLSTHDPLTGALNRAALEAQGQRIVQRACQGLRSVAVVMIDADHFKLINDTYGHPAGDAVLRHLACLLDQQMRPSDLLARYGGEEFMLVIDGLNLSAALSVAERLRRMVKREMVCIKPHAIAYTVSVGVACSDQHGYDLTELTSASDAAMYAAKKAGRNRVKAA